MIRFLLPFIFFLVFIGESVFIEFIPAQQFGDERIFVPRFTVILLILISIFLGRMQAIVYGLIFGLLFDIIYTNVLGVHMFLYPLISYVVSYFVKILHTNLFVLFFLSMLGVFSIELAVYGLYYLIGIHSMPWLEYVYERLFPTVILNAGFFILVLYPFQKLLLKLSNLQEKEV